jgi:hypothetical protein
MRNAREAASTLEIKSVKQKTASGYGGKKRVNMGHNLSAVLLKLTQPWDQ